MAFKGSFLKALQKLKDEELREGIYESILDAEKATTIRDITNLKKLKGYSSYYRIRVKNHRIGLKWNEDE